MSHSKVGICNIALASLGAASIRTFDEDNKRARMCDVFYDVCRDLLLSKFDWPFARKYAALAEIDTTGTDVPANESVYQLPNDCKTPRDLQSRGSNNPWHIMADHLHCNLGADVYLYYTRKETNPALFSDTFANLLSMLLAVRIGPSITKDVDLVKSLLEQYRVAQAEAWESDANIGDVYREHDEDPENDTFVNPDNRYLRDETKAWWDDS